jgi:hypothetical protein
VYILGGLIAEHWSTIVGTPTHAVIDKPSLLLNLPKKFTAENLVLIGDAKGNQKAISL